MSTALKNLLCVPAPLRDNHFHHMIQLDDLLARNLLPDAAIRLGIRNLLSKKLREETRENAVAQSEALAAFVDELKRSPIAIFEINHTLGYLNQCGGIGGGEILSLTQTQKQRRAMTRNYQ